MKNKILAVALIACVSVLIACGGGGGSDDSKPAPGTLDTSFCNGGIVITDYFYEDSGSTYSAYNEIYAIAIQNDGKIVVAGYVDTSGSTGEDFIIARYNTNGKLDEEFGPGGFVITDFGNIYECANAVALQSDGKIVVAGYTKDNSSKSDFVVARYDADGTPDSSFGSGGKKVHDLGSDSDCAYAVAIQSDGKIVVAGLTYDGSNDARFAIVRYEVNGDLDTSFDDDGVVVPNIGDNEFANAVVIQSDGKIVAAGTSNYYGKANFALARYNSNGDSDIEFGNNGTLITEFSSNGAFGYSIAIQSDGKIVVAGYVFDSSNKCDFALARYNVDGSLDPSFGANGKVITDMGSDSDYLYSVKIQSDGKIVVGGCSSVNSVPNFMIARYTSVGVLDSSFGNSGKVTIMVGDINNQINSLAIQSDGKIVAGGYNEESETGTSNFALIRLWP